MDLRHLRYFVAVAEEGHFGRAAHRLHIVQSALSMQIRALEEEIGGPLFLRTSRRVELTQAGELMLVEARRTLAQAERTKDQVQRSLRGEIGRVRVGFAGNALLTGKLTDDLRSFHAHYPAAELELCEMAPQLQAEAVLAGELDVGYSPSLGLSFDAQLSVDPIGHWPMILAMASDHPLARNPQVAASALAVEPMIFYAAREGDEGPLMQLRQLIGSEPQVEYRVSNTLGVLALAAAGLGVALVPAPLGNVTIPNITYREIVDCSLYVDLVLISRAQETGGSVQAFLRLARTHRLV